MNKRKYYLKVRNLLLSLGYKNEVIFLDAHFNVTFLLSKQNQIIKII